MVNYSCEKCGKTFKQKGHYMKHLQRKTPCDNIKDKIENIVEKKVDELMKEKLQDLVEKGDIEVKNKNLISSNQNSNTENTEMENKKSLKPIIKWSGGKKDEIKLFEKYIPNEYDIYIEPFIGGGSLYFNLCPKKSVIADVHKELICFYNSIKDGYIDDIYDFMVEHPNDEKVYYDVRDNMKIETDLDRAKQFYYQRKTCYRGMLRYNKNGKFNIPFGRYKNCNYEDLKNKEYEKLLKNTDIINDSFEVVFEKYNSENNFVFLDPPYDSEFTDYGYCNFGKEEHKKLAECFKNTKNKCLMIIGKTDFIVELYKDYIVEEYDKNYKFKIHSKRVGKEIDTKHLVIKNY